MRIVSVTENPAPARAASGALEKLQRMMEEQERRERAEKYSAQGEARESAGTRLPEGRRWDNRIGDFVDGEEA